MAVIIIPRRHIIQPQGRLVIAPEWADGLVGVFLPTEMSPDWQVTGTTGSFVPRRDGVAFDTNGGTTYVSKAVSEHQNTGFTMLVSGVARNNVAKDYAGIYNGGTYQALLYTPSSGRIFYYPRSGLSVDFTDAPALSIAGREGYVVAFGGDGSQHSGAMSLNGNLFEAGGGYSGTSPYDRVHVGSRFVTSGATSNTLAAFWRKHLSLAEKRDLAINPWQLFRADPVRIYSFPSGPIIPTLSGLTTSAITSSGARHSLTLTY